MLARSNTQAYYTNANSINKFEKHFFAALDFFSSFSISLTLS